MARACPQTVIVTGASGFIGRHLIEVLAEDYNVYALARRTQKEAGVARHPNLRWVLVDITDGERLHGVFRKILDGGRIDSIVHLAAYYDFGDQKMSDLYRRTNVEATATILDLARRCEVRRFVFASSLVASEFPRPGDTIDESSPLDATFPYAVTKILGETMVEKASRHFSCTVVRFAAVFSDWCEYEPLYYMLRRWLSHRWDARLVPGRGEMAIPYLHIDCVVQLLRAVLKDRDRLGRFDTLLASSDEALSHAELFALATRFYYGEERRPILLPVPLARAGVLARDAVGRLRRRRPFERLWMTRYLDRRLPTDCSRTRALMDWQPSRRHTLARRMLHLIENLKSMPDEWHRRNLARTERFASERPSLSLAQAMHRHHDRLVELVQRHLADPAHAARYPYYQSLEPARLRWYIERLYANLLTSVRHGDRSVLSAFGRDLARVRHSEGVAVEELAAAMDASRIVITRGLRRLPELRAHAQLVNDAIGLAIQLAIDEIEDTYNRLDGRPHCTSASRPVTTPSEVTSRNP